MTYEAQWVHCRTADLPVEDLPPAWTGLTILHLSDVHAGLFPTNERSLAKVVDWAEAQTYDLVFLTGDILGEPDKSRACLDLLARLRPTLGMFAVTGNHEYGLGKGPLARRRQTARLWEQADITLLSDDCVTLPHRGGEAVVLCGADYVSGGYDLCHRPPLETFAILLAHEPPPTDSRLCGRFPLAFSGHTHGGQLRTPGRSGLRPLHDDGGQRLGGVYPWGPGLLVVSRGVGTSFLPFRLLTRPEATLWRLV